MQDRIKSVPFPSLYKLLIKYLKTHLRAFNEDSEWNTKVQLIREKFQVSIQFIKQWFLFPSFLQIILQTLKPFWNFNCMRIQVPFSRTQGLSRKGAPSGGWAMWLAVTREPQLSMCSVGTGYQKDREMLRKHISQS